MKIRLVKPLRPDGRDERASIRQDRDYTVLAVECGMYRLLNEFGEPTLHDIEAFEVIDSTEPDFWNENIIDGCRYAGPPQWKNPGFFENWHDGVLTVKETFRADVAKHYPDVENDLTPRRIRSSMN